MEIRSTRSFHAIPVALIRAVFNLYLSKLPCKLFCLFHFINYISFFDHCKYFFKWQIFTYLLT